MTPATALACARDRMSGPFVWHDKDCCTAAANAFAELWGVDVAAHIRGAYRNALGAARILRAAGGYEPWFLTACRVAGLSRSVAPRAGDLVLIPLPAVFLGAVMALCFGPSDFALKGRDGITYLRRSVPGVIACGF